MANVSLDKDLFYQYMINNNSTSTMLNALSGNTNTGVQSANDLSSVLGALQNSASFGTGSISDVSTLLSGLEGISTTGTGNSFSDIFRLFLDVQCIIKSDFRHISHPFPPIIHRLFFNSVYSIIFACRLQACFFGIILFNFHIFNDTPDFLRYNIFEYFSLKS